MSTAALSDIGPKRDVIEALRWDSTVNAGKFAAERAVDRVSGVGAGADELDAKICCASGQRRTDEAMAIAAAGVLTSSRTMPCRPTSSGERAPMAG